MSGKPIYGVFSVAQKKFVFGIAEPSKRRAWGRLYEKIGKDAYSWEYQARRISRDECRT